MTHGSLFSGIGGIDLGFEWAGIETKWQVEIDDYCQKLLSLRFPHTKKFTDVRKVGSHNLEKVDIISGGFPCQDISVAGKGAGLEGERSGLWTELHRVISELRPRFAFIENVPMLTIRGGTRVIADLAEIGYDAEWQIVGADDVGAWHRRKRIWIVAYPTSDGCSSSGLSTEKSSKGITRKKIIRNSKRQVDVPDPESKRRQCGETRKQGVNPQRKERVSGRSNTGNVPDPGSKRLERHRGECELGESGEEIKVSRQSDVTNSNSSRSRQDTGESKLWSNRTKQSSAIKRIPDKTKSNQKPERRKDGLPDTDSNSRHKQRSTETRPRKKDIKGSSTRQEFISPRSQSYWAVEPNVGRVAHGIPKRVDRLKGIGNAVVPHIPYIIGKRLKELCQENQAEKH